MHAVKAIYSNMLIGYHSINLKVFIYWSRQNYSYKSQLILEKSNNDFIKTVSKNQ